MLGSDKDIVPRRVFTPAVRVNIVQATVGAPEDRYDIDNDADIPMGD